LQGSKNFVPTHRLQGLVTQLLASREPKQFQGFREFVSTHNYREWENQPENPKGVPTTPWLSRKWHGTIETTVNPDKSPR